MIKEKQQKNSQVNFVSQEMIRLRLSDEHLFRSVSSLNVTEMSGKVLEEPEKSRIHFAGKILTFLLR